MTSIESGFASDEGIAELLRRFESGELPPAEFGHRSHLAVALWYAAHHEASDAAVLMRRRLQNYLDCHGLGREVYHETLTLFWMKRVCAFVAEADGRRPLYQLANELAGAAGDARLVYDYYSEELIKSEEARRGWVEPDMKPLNF
jgi:hypothetical protein